MGRWQSERETRPKRQISDAARGDGVGDPIEDQASMLIDAISVEPDPAEADDDAGELADPAHVYQPNDDDDDRA